MPLRLILLFLLSVTFAAADPVAILPASFENAQQPQMTLGPDGVLHLVFGTKAPSTHTGPGRKPPTDGALYYTSSRDLTSFTAPVQIAALPKIALGMRRGPRVIASHNALLVTAQSHEDGNIHAWLSTDAGRTWQEQPSINGQPASAMEGLHALASNASGLTAIAWIDHRSGGAEVWSRISKDGGLTWQPERLVYRSPDGSVCQCCCPSIAITEDGRIAIMWRNALAGSRDLYSTTSTDAGRTFATASKLGSGTWTFNACPMDGGAIIWPASAAQPEAVWRRELTVFLSNSTSPETTVSGEAMQPLLAIVGQGRALLWESHGDLFLQPPSGKARTFAESARFASMIVLPGDRLAIAWESIAPGAAAPKLLFQVVAP